VAQELLGTLTIRWGECPAQVWWWRKSKKSNKPSNPPGMYKTAQKQRKNNSKTAQKQLKNGRFPALIDLTKAKNALKVLNKTCSKDVF
jgi:hypothetical protein